MNTPHKIKPLILKVLLVLTCAASTPLLKAQSDASPVTDEIVIGQTLGLQGGKNKHSSDVLEGIMLHFDQINKQGGIRGRRIALKVLDDDNKPALAEANARTLVEKDKVLLLFGSVEGGPSGAVMKIASEFNVPLFGPIAGSPTLRTPHNPLVFPVRAEHKEEFRVILQHALTLGLKRVGFIRSASDVGEKHLANVQKLSTETKMQFVADLPFKAEVSDTEIDAMVELLASQKVDVVFNHGNAQVYERLIRKTRAKNMSTVFYGVNSGSTQLAKQLGKLATGMGFTQVVPSPTSPKTQLARIFLTQYQKNHPGKTPTYSTLEGYITAWALTQGLEKAGSRPSRASFLNGLRNAELDLAGIKVIYRPGQHIGMSFTDLAVVDQQGVFRH
jgi:branched-chain amino acid transport system substrate-binding protein